MYQKTGENTDQARIRDIENVSSSDSKGGVARAGYEQPPERMRTVLAVI